jgi:hypothetical protein
MVDSERSNSTGIKTVNSVERKNERLRLRHFSRPARQAAGVIVILKPKYQNVLLFKALKKSCYSMIGHLIASNLAVNDG